MTTPNRVAVFTGPGRTELRTEILPELRPGEVLVRIYACALCTMEQRLWRGSQHAYPIAAGHETAGVIEATHPEGHGELRVGDRVAIAFLDRCMQCDACRQGQTQLCTGKLRERKPDLFRRIGGLADYAVVPAWKVFPLPSNRCLDEAALCEPLACVVHSVRKAELRLGDDVLVIGAGTMGHLHVLVARLRGARVFVSDLDKRKRELAVRGGACAAFNPGQLDAELREATQGRGADTVFVTFGSADTARQASTNVRAGGRIVYFGAFADDVFFDIDARRLHQEETILMGSRGQAIEDWHQASRLIARGLVDVRPLISSRFPLDRLTDALEDAIRPDTFRVIVHPCEDRARRQVT